MKAKVDLEAARHDSSFLDALRKLATVPKSAYDFVFNEEHIERLKKKRAGTGELTHNTPDGAIYFKFP